MINKQNRSARVVAGVVTLLVAAGSALGLDTDTASRVAEARAAYERAMVQLQEAELALAAAEQEAGVDAAVVAGRATVETATESGATRVQPEGEEIPEPQGGFFSWDSWDKSVNVGLNGASGNSDNLNLRIEIVGERKTEKMETTASALYRYAQQDSDDTENRVRLDLRNDWLPPEGSRWRWWAKGTYEYDEFQDWDSRLSGHGGFGYEFISNEKTTLVGRAGIGGSQTFGGMDEDFRPEVVLGLDFSHQIKENQKITAGTEAFLDVDDTDNFRLNSFIAYEAVIDAETGMNFKTGVSNRYDTEPGGTADKSDTEYFATLGWKF